MKIQGILVEDLYPCKDAAAKVQGRRPGKKINMRTLERWRHKGLKRGGRQVRLQAIRIGNDWYTSDRWVEEFFGGLNENQTATTSGGETPRTPTQRERASDAARHKLEAMWARRKAA